MPGCYRCHLARPSLNEDIERFESERPELAEYILDWGIHEQ